MPRPHCMFIQAQDVPWEKGSSEGWHDLDIKVLSRDKDTGASTMITRYPAGWTRPVPRSVTCHVEMLVLDGELEINGLTYGPYSYAHLCLTSAPLGQIEVIA